MGRCPSLPAALGRSDVGLVILPQNESVGQQGGRGYVWVTAAMEGTVRRENGAVGRYRVPISLMYPDRDPNGFGFVDVNACAIFRRWSD